MMDVSVDLERIKVWLGGQLMGDHARCRAKAMMIN
jgi:hypothetical protein